MQWNTQPGYPRRAKFWPRKVGSLLYVAVCVAEACRRKHTVVYPSKNQSGVWYDLGGINRTKVGARGGGTY